MIHLLDAKTIHKIAAGEVIERPASIVKELIENSLDAGASRIVVEVESGGKKHIRITDNGSGILPEDMPLAPLPHATSKLQTLDDLFCIQSFGFRGEALGSICHVAHLKIQSKTALFPATQISAYQDHLSSVETISHPQGTTIEVSDLFLDIPVRHKFLKSDATEFSYIHDNVLHFSLILPHVEFILKHNGKELLNSSGITDQKQRVSLFWGKELFSKLISIDFHLLGMHFRGCMSDPTYTCSNRSKQILSVNQRPIKSSLLQKAIQLGFKDLIPANRFPLIVLDIQMPAENVDVNVHPQKQEVRFLYTNQVFEAIPKLIQSSFNGGFSSMDSLNIPFEQRIGVQSQGAVIHTFEGREESSFSYPVTKIPYAIPETLFSPATFQEIKTSHFEFLQIYDTYLIVTAGHETWILDQHAVHERVLYEKFKDQSAMSKSILQPLLVSEIIDLKPDLFAIYLEQKPLLASLGFETEEFGPAQLVVRSVPAVFTLLDMKEWLLHFLDQSKEMPAYTPDLIVQQKETLQMAACKAAIKAGKKMSLAETKELLQDFIHSPSHYTCPHGRPLFVSLGKTELEKLFLRR